MARLAPGEYPLWIEGSAAQLGVSRATLEAAVKAIIAQREKDERERKAEAERERRRAEKDDIINASWTRGTPIPRTLPAAFTDLTCFAQRSSGWWA